MKRFEKELRAVERAETALEKAIDSAFPVGTKVAVVMSRGFMLGEVANTARKECVIVRCLNSGKVHHKHCTDVSYG